MFSLDLILLILDLLALLPEVDVVVRKLRFFWASDQAGEFGRSLAWDSNESQGGAADHSEVRGERSVLDVIQIERLLFHY